MLFVVFILAAIVFGFSFVNTLEGYEWWHTLVGGVSLIFVIVLIVAIFASLVMFGIEYVNIDGRIAAKEAERESLVYQLENDIYDNDNDLGKRELMVEIQEWNARLINSQHAQNNFWVGIYYADIYDQFEVIPLEN